MGVLLKFIVALHVLWVLFVLIGFLWTAAAFRVHRNFLDWFWIRTLHLTGILLVSLLNNLGLCCPLTVIEAYLRIQTGTVYQGSFILHYLHQWLGRAMDSSFLEICIWVILAGTVGAYLFQPPERTRRWCQRHSGWLRKASLAQKSSGSFKPYR